MINKYIKSSKNLDSILFMIQAETFYSVGPPCQESPTSSEHDTEDSTGAGKTKCTISRSTK